MECRRRTVSGTWETVVYAGSDRAILTSIGLEFTVAELYRGFDAT